jgi:hypothetical protein
VFTGPGYIGTKTVTFLNSFAVFIGTTTSKSFGIKEDQQGEEDDAVEHRPLLIHNNICSRADEIITTV